MNNSSAFYFVKLFAIFTSSEYLRKSSNTRFIKIINGLFIKILKGTFEKFEFINGVKKYIIKWSYAANFKRSSLTIFDKFSVWIEGIRYKIKVEKVDEDTIIKGSIHNFGVHKVQNKWICNIDFPRNFIEDSYHKSSYVAAAIFEKFFQDEKYKKYNLNDPNKSYIEGRSWINSRNHFNSFLVGYEFTGESLSEEIKTQIDNSEIDISIKGYNKEMAIRSLDVFDEMFKYRTRHIEIKLSDLSSTMINPNSVAGFEEVVIGHGIKKIAGSISKNFWTNMNFKVATIIFKRMIKMPKHKLMLIREIVIGGGREKMIKLDEDGNNFKFTRFIQIPSAVSLILINPISNTINNLLRHEYINTGLLFFENSEDSVGGSKSRGLLECGLIIEADVKNHDRTVGFKEILSAGAIILKLIGCRGVNFKLVCYSMSTLLKYYVYTHTGQIYRLSASMQTGNKLTSIINSLVCRLRIYILFLSHVDYMELINNDFNNLVIKNSGDDLIIGIKNLTNINSINKDILIIRYWRLFGAELTDYRAFANSPNLAFSDWDGPTFLGKTLKYDGTSDTPLQRTWKTLCGNSKTFLEGKSSFMNTLHSLIFSGSIAKEHHQAFAIIYVFLKKILYTENGKLHSLLVGKENMNHGNFWVNEGDERWEFSKRIILERLNDLLVKNYSEEIRSAEQLIRLYYWSSQGKISNEWTIKSSKLIPIRNFINGKLTKYEEVIYPIYLKMIESRIYSLEKKF